jgi:hypothetical protein
MAQALRHLNSLSRKLHLKELLLPITNAREKSKPGRFKAERICRQRKTFVNKYEKTNFFLHSARP